MITPEQNAQYLNDPESCPHCESDSIRAGEFEQTSHNTVFRPVTCNACNKEWEENFILTNITDQE